MVAKMSLVAKQGNVHSVKDEMEAAEMSMALERSLSTSRSARFVKMNIPKTGAGCAGNTKQGHRFDVSASISKLSLESPKKIVDFPSS